MRHRVSVRLTRDLADWLAETAQRTGLSQGRIIRDLLEKGRGGLPGRRFMRLAGSVRGPRELSLCNGFFAMMKG